MGERMRLLVGTKKGAFIYSSDNRRQRWELSDLLLPGWQIYHLVADTRCEPPRLYAAANNSWWGPSIARSADCGKTWDQHSPGLGFPTDMGITIGTVWHIRPGHERRPGVVYAGTSPAGLFRSQDWGASWQSMDGINRHPLRPYWSWIAGNEAMLHSIEIDPRDPDHLYVALSGAGSYVTCDGGASWRMFSYHVIATSPKARDDTARFEAEIQSRHPLMASPEARALISQNDTNLPADVDPAAVLDMHRMRIDPKNPDRVWAQAHLGVFRSDDAGCSWQDITANLPSYFGLPFAVTHHEPDAAYVVPLQSDEVHLCMGQLAVCRTRDGGSTWERLSCGLPGPDDYQSVFREGMDTDGLEPEGVYIGTSNGQVYASTDDSDRWQRLPGTLPAVLSVTCAVF